MSLKEKLNLFLPALVLLIYPGIFIAGIMGLAAQNEGSGILILIVYLFLIGSLLYPLIYLTTLITYFLIKKDSKKLVLKLFNTYLISLSILFFLWIILG